jgi:hypothetical protein
MRIHRRRMSTLSISLHESGTHITFAIVLCLFFEIINLSFACLKSFDLRAHFDASTIGAALSSQHTETRFSNYQKPFMGTVSGNPFSVSRATVPYLIALHSQCWFSIDYFPLTSAPLVKA